MPETQYIFTQNNKIAYELIGEGPLIVLSPGMADTRQSYRFLAPLLAQAGYRVASIDLRGHGESGTGWGSYTHLDTAADLIAVTQALSGGRPAVLVGQSFSGGAVSIVAAMRPDLVSAIVEIGPFTRPPQMSLSALLHNPPYRQGARLLLRFLLTGSIQAWLEYLEIAYPGRKPDDWHAYLSGLRAALTPASMKAAQQMGNSGATLKIAASKLADIRCPALILMGQHDSDFANPEHEARTLAKLLPAGTYQMIDHAGHYPHAQYPQEVAQAILNFLGAVTTRK